MQSLRELQRGFATAIFDASHAAAPLIRANGLSPAQRLGFYRTNIFGNYIKALELTYPAVRRILGRKQFNALAKGYIHRYAYGQGDLTAFGDQLAQFLSEFLEALDYPFLADLAQLEWAVEEVFGEADHPGLSAARLADLPLQQCEALRFLMHPTTRLLRSDYPVREIWKWATASAPSSAAAPLEPAAERLLLRRERLEVILEPVDDATFTMLSALSSGECFAAAYNRAVQVDPRFDAGAFLRRFVAVGVLADWTLPADEVSKA